MKRAFPGIREGSFYPSQMPALADDGHNPAMVSWVVEGLSTLPDTGEHVEATCDSGG